MNRPYGSDDPVRDLQGLAALSLRRPRRRLGHPRQVLLRLLQARKPPIPCCRRSTVSHPFFFCPFLLAPTSMPARPPLTLSSPRRPLTSNDAHITYIRRTSTTFYMLHAWWLASCLLSPTISLFVAASDQPCSQPLSSLPSLSFLLHILLLPVRTMVPVDTFCFPGETLPSFIYSSSIALCNGSFFVDFCSIPRLSFSTL